MFTQSLKAFCEWFAQRQERKILGEGGGAELMGGAVSQSTFLSALGAPKETRSLMARMAQKWGVRPEVLAHDNERTLLMAGACGRCKHRTLCKHWLDGSAKRVSAERFCANARHFANLRTQAGAHPIPRLPIGATERSRKRLH